MSFEELLKNLHHEYLASLPGKIGSIEQLLLRPDAAALREAFHKLKGTGTTYGVPEVSELAAVVETVCSTVPERAVTAAGQATALLKEIHQHRSQQRAFDLQSDPRFASVRDLLNQPLNAGS